MVPPGAIPAVLCQLSALQTALAARLAAVPSVPHGPAEPSAPDRLLSVDEAAPILGVSAKYLYRHARQFPFTRRLGRRVLRFSEAGLQWWLANRPK